MKFKFAFIVLLLWFLKSFPQDSLVTSLIRKHHKTFQPINNSFKGKGWKHIENNILNSKHVLIGEDHFSNEIPLFVKAVYNVKHFKNFYIEVDPFSTSILEKSIKEYSETKRQKFNNNYSELFSFYSFKPEYNLLNHIVKKGTKILGSDQIVANADRLIFDDLSLKTSSESARKIYEEISIASNKALGSFYNSTKNPMTMYLFSNSFLEKLNLLQTLALSNHENEVINALRKSIKIYTEQNHYYRVRLILNQLMKDYELWKDDATLFKYGANHLSRVESFLGNYDIGNVVANITASNFQETYHIMIVGESGNLGSIFKIFPEKRINKQKDFYLSYLTPFFEVTKKDTWNLFDLKPLRNQLLKGELKIANLNLERVIRGYDTLVIIPKVTAAKLMATD